MRPILILIAAFVLVFVAKKTVLAQETNLDSLFVQSKRAIGYDLDNALLKAQEGLRLSQERKDQAREIDFLSVLAEVYSRSDNFEAALSCAVKQEKLAKILNNKQGEASALNAQGLIYRQNGNFVDALVYLERALKIFGKQPQNKTVIISMASIDANMGNLLQNFEEFELAHLHLSRALVAFQQQDETMFANMCKLHLSSTLKNTNRLDSAYLLANEAKKFYLKSPRLDYLAFSYLYLGDIERRRSHYDSAIKHTKEFLRLHKTAIKNSNNELLGIFQLAEIYTACKKPKEALSTISVFFQDSAKLDADSRVVFYERLAETYSLLAEPSKAYLYMRLSSILKDSIQTKNKHELLLRARKSYELAQREVAMEHQKATLATENLKLETRRWVVISLVVSAIIAVSAFLWAWQKYRKAALVNRRNGEITAKLQEKQAQLDEQIRHTKLHSLLLEEINKDIAKKQEDMQASLRYAQTIQEALLPHKEKLTRIFGDYMLVFKPRAIVSGDFYWCGEIKEKDNGLLGKTIKVVAVGDCTGHGVPGGFMSVLAMSMLNELIKFGKHQNVSYILDKMHKNLREALKQRRRINEDGIDLALCIIQENNDGTRQLSFGGAGRPLYLYSQKNFLEIKGNKKSIGGKQKETVRRFETENIILKDSPATIYLVTDGFADQFDPQRRKFTSTKLKNLLLSVAHLDLDVQQHIVESGLTEHSVGAEQQDDITLLAVRI